MTANARAPQGAAAPGAPPSGLTPPRPHDAPLNLPADRSARIARAIAADDAEVSVSGAAIAEYSAEEISRLASIRERLAKAAVGKWVAYPDQMGESRRACCAVWDDEDQQVVCYLPLFTQDGKADLPYEQTADFIAHAPADMAWLLARLDALRESTAVAAPEGPA